MPQLLVDWSYDGVDLECFYKARVSLYNIVTKKSNVWEQKLTSLHDDECIVRISKNGFDDITQTPSSKIEDVDWPQ